MPRFTYCPSPSSRATRAASCSRERVTSGSCPYGPALDPLGRSLVGGQRQDPLNEDPGQMDVVWIQLARLDEPLDLRDRHLTGHRGQRVEVACGLVEDQVAVPVADRRSDQGEVRLDRLLQDIGPATELAGVLRR